MTNEFTFQCMECKKGIPDGTPMWSITINHETCDDFGITVHSSDCYHVFCEKCAGNKDFNGIMIPEKFPKRRKRFYMFG